MEHIQRAIEKARHEREGAIGQKTGEINNNSPLSTQSENQRNSYNAAVAVEYSSTRRITISDAELKERNIFAGFAHDPRSEPYRQLRSQVLKKMRAENWQTLAITSPTAGNGKTLTALNLAISLSQEVNQTVLLVDLDLRAPGVAAALGIQSVEHGIVDCVTSKIPLDEILINPGYNRLVIAPGTPQGHQTSEILSSPQMQTLQAELKGRYADRLIIYDLPALLTSDDALVFAPHADAVLLVLEDGGASESELKQAMKLLEGTSILGTVINKHR
ncbi:MAG: CpsD/CapB family tyrosine-protein kinase [Pseudomonadota bacterium]